MIEVSLINDKKPTEVDWAGVKHPVLVRQASGGIYLTVPTCYIDSHNYNYTERDAILVGNSYKTQKIGEKVYKLNLELCELYEGTITIKNKQ